MSLANPPQTTVDLRTEVPPGWQVSGLSAPKFDGVNFYRTLQPVSELRFTTSEPRYIWFTHQLFSPEQAVQSRVTLDGQVVAQPVFPAGQFITLYPGGFAQAGPHVLRFEQRCAAACTIRQYYAGVKLVAPPAARREVGLGATRWTLDTVQPALPISGLSGVQFDGNNFFREINTLSAASLNVPVGQQASELQTYTFSNSGDYRLIWKTAAGQSLTPRLRQDKPFWPKNQLTEQSVALLGKPTNKLSVQVECKGGGTACLPVRLYWTELTSLAVPGGLSDLSPANLGGSILVFGLLLTLFALLLRPARAIR
ncbi:hypothetical protein [Deinococcus sp.]|uniref:hypothetical protein n=1 Tax=Deinococcus sp. TaxID=47478 RepID=UPI003B5ABC52